MAFSDPATIVKNLSIDPESIIVEFGSGSGAYALAVARAVAAGQGRVVAIDIRPEMLSHLKTLAQAEKLSNIDYVQADLEKEGSLSSLEGIADWLLITNTLFQIDQKETAVRQAFAVLKSGGMLVCIDWADSFGGIGPSADHIIAEADAKKLFESAGFSFQKTIYSGDHHYGLVFKKGTL